MNWDSVNEKTCSEKRCALEFYVSSVKKDLANGIAFSRRSICYYDINFSPSKRFINLRSLLNVSFMLIRTVLNWCTIVIITKVHPKPSIEIFVRFIWLYMDNICEINLKYQESKGHFQLCAALSIIVVWCYVTFLCFPKSN